MRDNHVAKKKSLYLILYTEDLVDILVCLCNCNQKSKQSRQIKTQIHNYVGCVLALKTNQLLP